MEPYLPKRDRLDRRATLLLEDRRHRRVDASPSLNASPIEEESPSKMHVSATEPDFTLASGAL